MSLLDFAIVYLSVGAPLAVNYFFLNRALLQSKQLWLKTFLTLLFWIPFAIKIARREFVELRFGSSDDNEKSIEAAQKRVEKIFLESASKTSVFEFRETLARYVGLTLADETGTAKICEHEREIFRAAKIEDVQTAASCLARRNRQRLVRHQAAARNDFLQTIREAFDSSSDSQKFHDAIAAFVESLNDRAARLRLEEIYAARLSNAAPTLENLWKPETPKPPAARSTSFRPSALTATANSRTGD